MSFATFLQRRAASAAPLVLAAAVLGAWSGSASALVGPEDYPIATSHSDAVKPNLMLLMDTSTSMSFTHMPDEVEADYNNPRVGYFSFQCNVLYFNPAGGEYYKLPKRSDGSNMPEPRFSGAPYDAFADFPTAALATTYAALNNGDARLRNLNSAFRAFETTTRRNVSGGSDAAQRAYYWVYTATDGTRPQLAYDSPKCRDAASGTSFTATGGGTWTRYTLQDSDALAQQFARWYTYYRTRMSLMKSAISLAFNSNDPVIGPKYRVGMISMNPYAVDPATGAVSDSSTIQSGKYEPLRTFSDSAREQWFSKLFSQTPGGYSPAREGLARVGRHFANKTDSINSGMAYASGENPFQYSCQRNFTIMTTDGYWNTQNETRGPVKLDGTTLIGQEDGSFTGNGGNTPMGVYDGSTSGTRYRTTQANQYQIIACSTGQFYVSTTQNRARVVQYRERIDQTMKYEDKWQKVTTEFRRTVEQYKKSTHNWYTTQTQRMREQWQVNKSTRQYLEYRIEQRGGGYTQTQQWTKQDVRRTQRYQYRDEAYKYRNFQWNASTSRKTYEQYRWTRSVVQNKKTEQFQQKQVTQFKLTQTQYRATGYTDFATRSQQWGISWRYEVNSNETWQPASSSACSAAGAGNCRVRNVVADTVSYNTSSIPTTNAPMVSCTASSPSSSNQWTTTTCESTRRYLDGSGNYVGSATPVAVNPCNAGMSGTTLTECSRTPFTDIPVKSCSGGFSGYVNPTIVTQSVVTSCPTAGTVTQAATPANITSCSGYPSQMSASPYTLTTCASTGYTYTTVPWNSCTAASATSPEWAKTECQVRYCATANCADSAGQAGATSFGINEASPSCSASTIANHNVSCAPANNAAEALNALTCTNQTGNSGNGWTAKTCNPRVQVTALGPVANCTPGTTKSNTSPFVISVCVNETTGPTPKYSEALCPTIAANAGNDYTASSCVKTITNDNTATAPCTSIDNTNSPYVHKECYSNVTTGYLAAACVAGGPSSPGFVQRTCPSNFDESVGVPFGTCAAQAHTFNGTDTVSCTTTNTGWVNVPSCTPQSPSSANGYLEITCQTIEVAGNQLNCNLTPDHCVTVYEFPNQPVAACTYTPGTGQITSSSAGSITYLNTNANGRRFYCTVLTTDPAPAFACTSGNSGNPTNANPAPSTAHIQTTCDQTAIVTDYVDPASCAVGTTISNTTPFTRTRCSNVFVTDVSGAVNDRPTADCTAGFNSTTKVTTACRETSTPLTPIATCSLANGGIEPASSTNGYTSSECQRTVTPNVPGPASCTVGATDANFVRVTICQTPTPVAEFVASCTGVAQTANAGNSYTRITCAAAAGYPTTPIAVELGTCNAGFNSTTGVTTVCNRTDTSWKYVGICTNGVGIVEPNLGNNWRRTECEPTNSSSGTVHVGTGITGSTWDSATSSFVFRPVSDCPASQTGAAGNNWMSVTCESTTTPSGSPQASCTPIAASAGNNYTSTDCTAIQGQQVQYKGTTTRISEVLSGIDPPVVVRSSSSVIVAPGAWANIGSCQATVSVPTTITVPSPADIFAQVGSVAPELDGCTDWASCVGPVSGGGSDGSTGSLADVAQYFYVTDLKPNGTATTGSLSPKNADDPLSDRVTHTHMTTFTVGMGVSGLVGYEDGYQTSTTGDFRKILLDQQLAYGGRNWPVWPDTAISSSTPLSYFDNPRSIDDFWHTAVNGRGRYLSAGDPEKVVAGLRGVLVDIDSNTGAGSAASTSTPVPVAGDNALFRANFDTKYWTGELTATTIDPIERTISSTLTWSASALLDAKVGAACDNRTIFYFKPSESRKLANFAWNSSPCNSSMQPTGTALNDLAGDSNVNGYFDATEAALMTQYAVASYGGTTDSAGQRPLAVGANLVNFLRGQRGKEGFIGGDNNKLFRAREHVLGTIVGSQPLYVKAPNREYSDAGYYAFKTDTTVAARQPMIYVGANDGMMHAFNATTGQEVWAYVPTMVMSDLYKQANVDYQHGFSVDGTLVSGDIVVDHTASTPVWKTIVVGGLNKGGRGFYALDVTNPTTTGVRALWEFKGSSTCRDQQAAVGQSDDCGVGLSFGRPIITKLATGQWVVLVTSGYDGEAYGGDGKSYLYVLNAYTGTIIHKIPASTTVGSGLREIETYVSDPSRNNTAQRAYGGDLLGNIWRFDINGNLAPSPSTPSEAKYEATLVARAADANGDAQPITTRIIVGEVRGKTLLVAGTGQLLNQNDLTVSNPAKVQSVYAFTDTAIGASSDGVAGNVLFPNATGTGSLRGTLKPLEFATIADTDGKQRTVRCDTDAANYSESLCNSSMNWRVDLPAAGERVNIDMTTVGNTLVFVTNIPSTADACSVGGFAFLNQVDILTGLPLGGTGSVASNQLMFNALVVGSTLTRYAPPSSSGCTGPDCEPPCTGPDCEKKNCEDLLTLTGANNTLDSQCVVKNNPGADGRRVSWRELIRE